MIWIGFSSRELIKLH